MDFARNEYYLSEHQIKLSASSEFYLKMSVRFAFFLSSVELDAMMYPRLILSDNMEDKGLEEERSHNFQKVLVQRLRELTGEVAEPDYQVIFATSMICSGAEQAGIHHWSRIYRKQQELEACVILALAILKLANTFLERRTV